MFKTGIITHEISRDFEYALEVIKKLGIRYIEIHSLWNKTIENLSDKEAKRAKKLISKYQLKVSNISSTCFLLCPLVTRQERLRNVLEDFIAMWGDYSDHLHYLKRSIQLAKMFETDLVRIFGFRSMNPSQDLDEKVLNMIVDKFEEPVKLAEKAAVTLILENCPFSYLGEGRLTCKVLERINSENLKLLWDPCNTARAGGNPFPDDYQFVRNHIAHIHLKDIGKQKVSEKVRTIPIGEGEIDYKQIFQVLHRDGYKGVISLEPEYLSEEGYPEPGTRKSFGNVRQILDDLSFRG